MVDNTTTWTLGKFTEFYAKVYECVHDEGMADDETFMFDGHEFVVGYAKYLCQYLSSQFNKD